MLCFPVSAAGVVPLEDHLPERVFNSLELRDHILRHLRVTDIQQPARQRDTYGDDDGLVLRTDSYVGVHVSLCCVCTNTLLTALCYTIHCYKMLLKYSKAVQKKMC